MKTNADQVITNQANSTLSDLSGLIERVTYHNEESGFCVLRVKARGHRDLITGYHKVFASLTEFDKRLTEAESALPKNE